MTHSDIPLNPATISSAQFLSSSLRQESLKELSRVPGFHFLKSHWLLGQLPVGFYPQQVWSSSQQPPPGQNQSQVSALLLLHPPAAELPALLCMKGFLLKAPMTQTLLVFLLPQATHSQPTLEWAFLLNPTSSIPNSIFRPPLLSHRALL